MKPSVYVETTIIGYLTARDGKDDLSNLRYRITRDWWAEQRLWFDVRIAEVVIREAVGQAQGVAVSLRQQVMDALPLLTVDLDRAARLSGHLLGPRLIPLMKADDALHIAVASVTQMDYLLTWNMKHLTNPTIRLRVESMLRDMGAHVPLIRTPLELTRADLQPEDE